MKSMIAASLLAAGLALAGPASASEDLAQKSGCTKCHATAAKKIGPSVKEIAAKFKGKAGSAAALVAKVKAGKEHPPSKASEDDLKKIVAWMLAM